MGRAGALSHGERGDRASHGAAGREDLRAIAIGKNRPAAAGHAIEVTRRGDLEALHAAREGGLVIGLDEQLEPRRTDTELDDPEVCPAE